MTPDQVPAELIDAVRRADSEWSRERVHICAPWTALTDDQIRMALAAVLPAAHDMWRETAINDAAPLLIHSDGLTLTCGPCDAVLFRGWKSVGAAALISATLGHLASPQHTGRRT